MISRILPPEEWPRLNGTEAEKAWPLFNPENTRVYVVEDEGQIVACWTMLRMVHAECLWIAPSHRGSFGVFKRLIGGMRESAKIWGAASVITGSVTEAVTRIIARLGGEPLPGLMFALPAVAPTAKELGEKFHAQMAAQIAEPHVDGAPDHDEVVGRALQIAINDGHPVVAQDFYNEWAKREGYDPAQYLGEVDGRMRARIGPTVIEADEAFNFKVISEGPCPQE